MKNSNSIYQLPPFSIDELLVFCQTIQRRAQAHLTESWCRLLILRAVDLMDWSAANHRLLSEAPLWTVHHEALDRARQLATGRRDPEVDFRFDARFYLGESHCYAEVQTERRDFLGIWENHPQMEIVTTSDLPLESPFEFSFTSVSDLAWKRTLTEVAKRIAMIPDLHLRLDRLARRWLERERLHDTKKDTRADYMEFQDWLRSEEGEEALFQTQRFLSTKVPAQVISEDLLGNLPHSEPELNPSTTG